VSQKNVPLIFLW